VRRLLHPLVVILGKGSGRASAELALFYGQKSAIKPFWPSQCRGVFPGVQGRKIAAHATPSLAMVRYYTMAHSAATAKFFFSLSPQAAPRPGVSLGALFVCRIGSVLGSAGLAWEEIVYMSLLSVLIFFRSSVHDRASVYTTRLSSLVRARLLQPPGGTALRSKTYP